MKKLTLSERSVAVPSCAGTEFAGDLLSRTARTATVRRPSVSTAPVARKESAERRFATKRPEPAPFKLGYRSELEGVRAIAVLSVMAVHAHWIGSGADLSKATLDLYPMGFAGGLFGVDVFFVLSGFLITSLLLQEHRTWGQIDLRAFYTRRIMRLSPAMLMMLGACSVYLLSRGGSSGSFDWSAVLYASFYLSNFALIFGGFALGMLTPTWTLSVEEQFYSMWPLAMTRLAAIPRRATVVKILLTAILGAWALRMLLHESAYAFGAWSLGTSALYLIFARADGLLCGALVAFVAHWGWLPDAARHGAKLQLLGWFCALTIAALIWFGPGPLTDGLPNAVVLYNCYAYLSVATALLIVVLLVAPPKAMLTLLRWRPLAWTGKISYGLYLYHMFIFVMIPVATLGQGLSFVLAFALSFAVAAVSYFAVEKRFLDLRGTLGLPRLARLARAIQGETPAPLAAAESGLGGARG
nr:acyltransferase [Methylocystis sp. WRRC1]